MAVPLTAPSAVRTGADPAELVPALALGEQEVRVEKTSFKPVVRSGVHLVVGQEAVVNVQLELGPLSQDVVVSADAPLVNTTTAAVAGLVGEREVKDLPLNGRSFDALLALNPSAINYGLKSPQTSTSNGNTFSVAGRRPLDNLFLLNGIEYTGSSQLAVTPGGVSGELLGIDAVREFNVLTSSAETSTSCPARTDGQSSANCQTAKTMPTTWRAAFRPSAPIAAPAARDALATTGIMPSPCPTPRR